MSEPTSATVEVQRPAFLELLSPATDVRIVVDNAKGHPSSKPDVARPRAFRRTRTGSFVPADRRARSPPPQQRPAFVANATAKALTMPRRHDEDAPGYYLSHRGFRNSNGSSRHGSTSGYSEPVDTHPCDNEMSLNRLFRPLPMPQNVTKPERQISIDLDLADIPGEAQDGAALTENKRGSVAKPISILDDLMKYLDCFDTDSRSPHSSFSDHEGLDEALRFAN